MSVPSDPPAGVFASALTASAPAGIAVILLRRRDGRSDPAGPLRPLFRSRGGKPLPAELGDRVVYGDLIADGEVIDDVVISRGPAGIEIHCHGGPAVVRRILAALAAGGAQIEPGDAAVRWAGARTGSAAPATDSTAPAIRAEALAVLPQALTWRSVEILMGQSEAGLAAAARRALDTGDLSELRRAAPAAVGRRLYEPPTVVIAGKPNVGKSTLANALFGSDRAIVSAVPGTTRDWSHDPVELDGLAVRLSDTAGIRPTDDPIEREGVSRAVERIGLADAVIVLLDGSRPVEADDDGLIRRLAGDRRAVWARNKADLPPAWTDGPAGMIAISAARQTGLTELIAAVMGRLGLEGLSAETPVMFTERQERLAAAALDTSGAERGEKLRELLGL